MPAAVGRVPRATGPEQAKNGKRPKKAPTRIKSHKFRAQDFVRKRQNESLTDHYTIGKLLGEGQFGEVFIGTVKQSNGGRGDNRAIKRIQKELLTEEDHDEVFNEFTTLKQMDHPNICKMYEFFEDQDSFWFVQELCGGGELLDELERLESFSEASAALIMKQVLSSVHYCHSQKHVVHRDLKLENILLEEQGKTSNNNNSSSTYNPMIVKVIDFGLATTYTADQVLTSPVGSMHYIAPEVLEQEYNYKCDVWSCGVIAYILLCGYAPFEGATDRDMRELIMMGHVSFEDDIWQNSISQDAKDFVSYLLTYEPENRPDAGQALQHKWIQNLSKVHAEQFKATKSGTDAAVRLLSNCRSFESASKLKQATCAFMTSQLVLSGEAEEEEDKRDETDAAAQANHAMIIGEIFRAIDLDSDGRLSREELRMGFLDFLGEDAGLTVEEVDDIFARMDLSFTGYVDYSEFVVASMGLHDLEQGNHKDLLKQAFERLLDKDGSGFISHEKLRKEMTPFYGEDVEEEIIKKIIDQADVDQDGQISWDDFQAMMTKTASFVAPEGAAPLARHSNHSHSSSHSSSSKEEPAEEIATSTTEEEPTKAEEPVQVEDKAEPTADETEESKPEQPVTPVDDATIIKTPTTTPARTVRRRGSANGPKARLISAVFEKNMEKNRELGFDKFAYIRKQSSTVGQKRKLPRTRRVNFEELTKKANTQVNFDARAARAGRRKEIEELKSTPGRARERRATIATMVQQEKEEQHRNRRESRMLELESIKTHTNATDRRRQQVRSSFQETNARKAQEKRSEELAKLRAAEDNGAKKRLFELWNQPPPSSPSSQPSAGARRASQVQVVKDLKLFQQMFDQAAQEGTLKERFVNHRPSLQASAIFSRTSRGWTKRLSGKSYRDPQDENLTSKNSSHHAKRGLDRASSQLALFDFEEIDDRLVDMQPEATDDAAARLIEPIRRSNSFNSIHEDDERDERLDGMIGETQPRSKADPGPEDEQFNSSVVMTREKREARLKELDQLKVQKSGRAKSAREHFEETIQANIEAEIKARSTRRNTIAISGRRNSVANMGRPKPPSIATQKRRCSIGATPVTNSKATETDDEPKRNSINWKELGKDKADIHAPPKELDPEELAETVHRGSKSTSHMDYGSKSASHIDNSISSLGYEEADKNHHGSLKVMSSHFGNSSISEHHNGSMNSIGMGGSIGDLSCSSPVPASPGKRRSSYNKMPKNTPRLGTPTTPKSRKPGRRGVGGGKANRRASATPTMTAPPGMGVTEAQMKFLHMANERAMKAKAKESAA